MGLGSNIRYLRKKMEWAQEQLADLLGYKNFTTIQKWESGVAEPPFGTVVRLADLFKVDIDSLASVDLERTLSDVTVLDQAGHASIPVYSYVSAGNGAFASDANIEGYIPIPDSMAKRGDFFALRVRGDSL